MRKIISSLIYAINGLRSAYKHDTSFRLEIWGSLIFIVFVYASWPLEKYELLFLVLAYALILIAELINTAFERALEKLHPEHDALIGLSKDIAAAAVLVAIIFAIVVAGSILAVRL